MRRYVVLPSQTPPFLIILTTRHEIIPARLSRSEGAKECSRSLGWWRWVFEKSKLVEVAVL